MAKLDYSGLSRLLNDLKAKLVPQSRTINGIPLTSDITLPSSLGIVIYATCSTPSSTLNKIGVTNASIPQPPPRGLTAVLVCETEWFSANYNLNLGNTGNYPLLTTPGNRYTGVIPAGYVMILTMAPTTVAGWIIINPPSNVTNVYGMATPATSAPSPNTSTSGSIGTINGRYATASHGHATPLATISQAGVLYKSVLEVTLHAGSSWVGGDPYECRVGYTGVTSQFTPEIGLRPDASATLARLQFAEWHKLAPNLKIESDANLVVLTSYGYNPEIDLPVTIRVVQ